MFAGLSPQTAIIVQVAAVPVLYIATIALGRWLKRRSGVQLGLLYHVFCIILALWLPLEVFGTAFPSRPSLMRLGRAAVVLLGAFFLLALVKRYFWELWYERQQKERAPKFLSQITALVVVLVAIFVIIGGVYGHSIEGVIFGSTVVVGIVGFAMQDLLGNLIAGIALEIGRPFRTGDWLIVEGQHAEVIEVNWRSTRVCTNDEIYLDVPNKTIVGATITNLTFPRRQHAIRISVGFEYSVPPNLVKDVIGRAAGAASGVLADPPTKVYVKDFGDSAVIYEIRFWLVEEARFNEILDGVRTNIWYAAQRHGLTIPFPIRTLQIERPKAPRQDAQAALRATVRRQPFLQLLDEAQVDRLLSTARLLRFGRGEKVIHQGAAGDSMFILLKGEADVLIDASGQNTRVATLRDGDYCGEMSLLTGEPRSATVVARTDCEMWEIAKPVMAEFLEKNATLVQKLGELLAERRMETEGILASTAGAEHISTKQKEYTAGFLKKLSSFFEL